MKKNLLLVASLVLSSYGSAFGAAGPTQEQIKAETRTEFQNEPKFKTLMDKVDNLAAQGGAKYAAARNWQAEMVDLIFSKKKYSDSIKNYGAMFLFSNVMDQMKKVSDLSGVVDLGSLTVAYRTWKSPQTGAATRGPVPATWEEGSRAAAAEYKKVLIEAKKTSGAVEKIKADMAAAAA